MYPTKQAAAQPAPVRASDSKKIAKLESNRKKQLKETFFFSQKLSNLLSLEDEYNSNGSSFERIYSIGGADSI